MYAVIETGSKQFRVSQGDVIEVETLAVKPGDQVSFEQVLLVSDGQKISVGKPTVDGVKVTATVEGHGRGKKVIIYKHYKNYHKRQGHRQNFTRLHIDEISSQPTGMPSFEKSNGGEV